MKLPHINLNLYQGARNRLPVSLHHVLVRPLVYGIFMKRHWTIITDISNCRTVTSGEHNNRVKGIEIS